MSDPKTFYYTLMDGVDLHDEIKIGDFLYEIIDINYADGMMTVERITDENLKGEYPGICNANLERSRCRKNTYI